MTELTPATWAQASIQGLVTRVKGMEKNIRSLIRIRFAVTYPDADSRRETADHIDNILSSAFLVTEMSSRLQTLLRTYTELGHDVDDRVLNSLQPTVDSIESLIETINKEINYFSKTDGQ